MSAIENTTPVKKTFKVKKTVTMPVEELDEEETAIVALPICAPRATPLVHKTITIRVDEYEALLQNKKQLDALLKKADDLRAKKNAASKKCYEKKKKTVTAVKAKLEERIEKLEKVILKNEEEEVIGVCDWCEYEKKLVSYKDADGDDNMMCENCISQHEKAKDPEHEAAFEAACEDEEDE